MEDKRPLASISDDELLRRLAGLLRQSRCVESELIEHIAEVDERRLYAREASPSMFAYCTEVLHLSEAEAYLRISVARVSRKYPVLLSLLSDGRLHLTGIAKLAPLLTPGNEQMLLARAVHKSKREILELVAEIAPRPDAPALMRRLPERKRVTSPGSSRRQDDAGPLGVYPDPRRAADASVRPVRGASADVGAADEAGAVVAPFGGDRDAAAEREQRPDGVITDFAALRPDRVGASALQIGPVAVAADRSVLEPLAPGRYKIQFTASARLREKLERLRSLLRPEVPDGDLAAIIERAVTDKLERIEASRFGGTRRPRKGLSQTDTSPRTRHIPAAVRRAVHERDGMRCGFVDDGGRRCSKRHRLEYHHRHPFGVGGDHSPANIGLLCRTHNTWLAEHDYGREAIARQRGSKGRDSRAGP
jgi:hypothetical protein